MATCHPGFRVRDRAPTRRLDAADAPGSNALRRRDVGAPGEPATLCVRDLSGAALEPQAFRHPEHVRTP